MFVWDDVVVELACMVLDKVSPALDGTPWFSLSLFESGALELVEALYECSDDDDDDDEEEEEAILLPFGIDSVIFGLPREFPCPLASSCMDVLFS